LPLIERRNIPINKHWMKKPWLCLEKNMAIMSVLLNLVEHGIMWWNVSNTADIWSFKIVSEGAVAAGIRRIEAITGDVRNHFSAQGKLDEIKLALKKPQDTFKAVVFTRGKY
jgi:alanyl-tRNA synthetase